MNKILYLASFVSRAILPERLFCILGYHTVISDKDGKACLLCKKALSSGEAKK